LRLADALQKQEEAKKYRGLKPQALARLGAQNQAEQAELLAVLAGPTATAVQAANREASRLIQKYLSQRPQRAVGSDLAGEMEGLMLDDGPYLFKTNLGDLWKTWNVLKRASAKAADENRRSRLGFIEIPWEDSPKDATQADSLTEGSEGGLTSSIEEGQSSDESVISGGSQDSEFFLPEILAQRLPAAEEAARKADIPGFAAAARIAFRYLEMRIYPGLHRIASKGVLGPAQRETLHSYDRQVRGLELKIHGIMQRYGIAEKTGPRMVPRHPWGRSAFSAGQLLDQIHAVERRILGRDRREAQKALRSWSAIERLREDSDGRIIPHLLEFKKYYEQRLKRAEEVSDPEYLRMTARKIEKGKENFPPFSRFEQAVGFALAQEGHSRAYAFGLWKGVLAAISGLAAFIFLAHWSTSFLGILCLIVCTLGAAKIIFIAVGMDRLAALGPELRHLKDRLAHARRS
jgi:hypothetical protein